MSGFVIDLKKMKSMIKDELNKIKKEEYLYLEYIKQQNDLRFLSKEEYLQALCSYIEIGKPFTSMGKKYPAMVTKKTEKIYEGNELIIHHWAEEGATPCPLGLCVGEMTTGYTVVKMKKK